jgi:hypothetical protein
MPKNRFRDQKIQKYHILILPVIFKNKTIGLLHIIIDFVFKVKLRQASVGLTL